MKPWTLHRLQMLYGIEPIPGLYDHLAGVCNRLQNRRNKGYLSGYLDGILDMAHSLQHTLDDMHCDHLVQTIGEAEALLGVGVKA